MPQAASAQPTSTPAGFSPIRALLSLFSSIWLGVILLALLFIYTSVGSSGVPTHPNIFDPAHWASVRQMRPFELTEFEWFNWWPFKVLIVLICINIVVATLRRIPFNVINLGVWMIHAGIIMLCLGGVWYFGTKVEGDAPILRRRLVIEAPNGEKASLPAQAGAMTAVGTGDDRYILQVQSIDPRWELLSGEEKGQHAYKVSVAVQSKGGRFIRDLIANRPQYTQDIIPSNDPKQPMQRAIKVTGKALVDEALKLSLDYEQQKYFYVVDSRAIYLREVDAGGHPKGDWVQRPIPHGLPRYNDYIADSNDVWMPAGANAIAPDPLDVVVPAHDPDDPLPGVDLRISRYLRYAGLSSRWKNNDTGPVNPRVAVTIALPGGQQDQQFDLLALDPEHSGALEDTRGNRNMVFTWVGTQQELDALTRRVEPVLQFTFPASGKTVEETIAATIASDPKLEFKAIEGTDYSYRVENLQDNVDFGNGVNSVAIVQIKSPKRTFTRWVFNDSKFNRDMAMAEDATAQHNAQIETDAEIQSVYRQGTYPPAPIVLVAGPGETQLSMIVTPELGEPRLTPLKQGDVVDVVSGVTMRVDRFAPRSVEETRPEIVPREQRDRQVGEMMSTICVDLPKAAMGTAETAAERAWLPYHHYAFSSFDDVLRRFPYRPTSITLADGRRIEMMFSRQRLPLPAPVALEDFAVDTHIGGFTGQTSSIMDWKSLVRFKGKNGEWLPVQTVRVNKPTEFDGFWFFQAQWDPPEPPRGNGDPGSMGLNYTVLGVGNRNGVNVMLAGCCIAVFGMFYAFYVKPAVKRRRQQKVYREVDRQRLDRAVARERAASPESEPVGAAWKVQS